MTRPSYVVLGSLFAFVAACRDTSGPTPTPTPAPPAAARAETGEHKRNEKDPVWWNKYQFLLHRGPINHAELSLAASVGENVDVSNECAAQRNLHHAQPEPSGRVDGRVQRDLPPAATGVLLLGRWEQLGWGRRAPSHVAVRAA